MSVLEVLITGYNEIEISLKTDELGTVSRAMENINIYWVMGRHDHGGPLVDRGGVHAGSRPG